jgi:hypothetical protein
MPRTGLAYEKPSRVAQVLVIGFTIAVIAMAGWLVMMILISHDGNTMAANPADLELAAKTPPRVETTASWSLPGAAPASVATPTPAPTPDQPPQPSLGPRAVATIAALPPSAAATPAAPPATYTTSSVPRGASDMVDRAPVDASLPQSDTAGESPEASSRIVPLPPPKPRRVAAAVPVPRPRPHLDSDDPPQERTFFDFLVNRQR